ncbi:MAG: hypothetical protein EXR49_03430 [Dehalococcoidia bacterium]|nr:hypothetical protein [Dehalococcoidia bacterium]
MQQANGNRLQVTWKNFILEQVNSKNGPAWFIWDQPEEYPARTMRAHRLVEAARLQGPEAYARLHYALLAGRHEHRKDLADPNDLWAIAGTLELDLQRLRRDAADPARLQTIAADHLGALKQGIFGTPTFVFDNGSSFFARIKAPEAADEAARVFDGLYDLFVQRRVLDEVKRPRPPAA